MLADPGLAYAWGGSMGILRETFERAEVARRWEKALTDDFPLTDAVRRLGLAVHFVPRCLLASHEDTSLRDCLEWTNRQTIICRVYNPSLWRGLFVFHAIHAVAVLLGTGLLVAGAMAPDVGIPAWPAAAMVAVLLIEGFSGLILWATVRGLLPEIGGWRRALRHVCLAPSAILLIFYNSIYSLCTRDICWRGVLYRLHSSDHTEVLAKSVSSEAA